MKMPVYFLALKTLPLRWKKVARCHDLNIRQPIVFKVGLIIRTRISGRYVHAYLDSATRIEYETGNKRAIFLRDCRRGCRDARRVLAVLRNPVSRFAFSAMFLNWLSACLFICLSVFPPACSTRVCWSVYLSTYRFTVQFFVSVAVVFADRDFNGWKIVISNVPTESADQWKQCIMQCARFAKENSEILFARVYPADGDQRSAHLHLPFYLYFITRTRPRGIAYISMNLHPNVHYWLLDSTSQSNRKRRKRLGEFQFTQLATSCAHSLRKVGTKKSAGNKIFAQRRRINVCVAT